jgi:hypothetical protein
MGLIVLVGLFAAPILFGLIHLFFIVPWYVALAEFRCLSYFRLYLLSYMSALLVWLFIANASHGMTYQEVVATAVFIGIAFLWIVSLFWWLSYKWEGKTRP